MAQNINTVTQAVFSIIDSDPIWFLIASSAVLIISIAICLWAYSSILNTGKGVNGKYLRAQLHKLPYQENRFKGGSKQPGNHPPDRNPPLPGGHFRSHHRREHPVVDDPEIGITPSGIRAERHGWRPGNFERVSSSSSSAPNMHAYERTHSARKQQQRSQSNMMYTRRRTPQSSSMQNPSASHSHGPRPPPHFGPGAHSVRFATRPGREVPIYGRPGRQEQSHSTLGTPEIRIETRDREAELRRTEDARTREEEERLAARRRAEE